VRDGKVWMVCWSSVGVLSWAGPAMAQEPDATLQAVVVSGARSERALADVPAVVDVMQGTDLDAAKVQDIRDLVRELPNVSVKRAPQRFGAVMGSTGRDGNAGFNIRGLEGNRVLLTVDGIRVPRELSSGVFGSASFGRDYYDLGLISRVEILRGANSALYGSDGLAGMVSMTTTEPADVLKKDQTFGGRVGVRHDTENGSTGLGLTLAAQPSPTVQWLASVQTGRAKALDNQGTNDALNSTRTTPNPQTDQDQSLLAKLVLTPHAHQKHTLTLEHVDKSSEVAAYTARGMAMGVQTLNLDGTTDMVRSRLSWDGRFTINTLWADTLRASVGFQDAKSQEVTGSDEISAGQPRQRSRDVTYTEQLWQGVLQAEKTRPIGQDWGQKVVYGMDVSVATLDNLVTGTLPPSYERYPLKRFPKTRETTSALFVQSEFASQHWSFIPALRYDHYALKPQADALYPLAATSLSDAALSPKLGVIFRPADSWSVFGNLAAGFKAPSPLQLNNYFENPFGNYKTIPNPDLKPETSQTLELGVRGGQERTNWEVAAFSGRYKDFIEELVAVGGSASNRADPLRYQAVNRGRVKLSGFEFKGQIPMGKATVFKAAYGQTTGTDSVSGRPINSVNPAKLMLGADHQMGAWKLGATLSHVAKKSAKDIDNSTTANQFATPAHTTLDLSSSWQLRPGLRLSGAVRNLTDKKYWDWTNVRGVAASSPVIDAYTAPGRSLSVALVADF
jgi:hemoglobin/transferrin/lactoferrin receptor protein